MYAAGTNRMRMRMFHTQQDVHPNQIFSPVVTAPSASADYKPRVDWSKFHEVVPLMSDELKNPHLERVSKAWGALSGGMPGPVVFLLLCPCNMSWFVLAVLLQASNANLIAKNAKQSMQVCANQLSCFQKQTHLNLSIGSCCIACK